jgi:hypothetical protein
MSLIPPMCSHLDKVHGKTADVAGQAPGKTWKALSPHRASKSGEVGEKAGQLSVLVVSD